MRTEPEPVPTPAAAAAEAQPAASSPFTMVGEAADICVDRVCAIPEDNNADAPAHTSGRN